jgi:hypothetical protein
MHSTALQDTTLAFIITLLSALSLGLLSDLIPFRLLTRILYTYFICLKPCLYYPLRSHHHNSTWWKWQVTELLHHTLLGTLLLLPSPLAQIVFSECSCRHIMLYSLLRYVLSTKYEIVHVCTWLMLKCICHGSFAKAVFRRIFAASLKK